MKYFFQSMLGAMLLLSGVFAFSSCGNDESDPDLSLIHISEPTRPY